MISDHAVKNYVYAIDNYHPWYLHDSSLDGRITLVPLLVRARREPRCVDWFESGWTSHAFIKPVSGGDTISAHGKIQDKRVEANGTRLILEVWCRNQAGDLTTVGSASAVVSR